MSALIKSRAAGLLLYDNRILLARHVGQTFWTVPGGRQERGESLEECVAREFREETGFDVAATRLLYVGDFITESQQVLDTCFLVEFGSAPRTLIPHTTVDGSVSAIEWFELAEAVRLPIGPPALRNLIDQLVGLAGDSHSLPTLYAGRYGISPV